MTLKTIQSEPIGPSHTEVFAVVRLNEIEIIFLSMEEAREYLEDCFGDDTEELGAINGYHIIKYKIERIEESVF